MAGHGGPIAARRGAEWVAAQLVLMGLIVVAGPLAARWPDAARTPFAVLGAVAASVGALFAGWSVSALGRSLTPFPRPAPGGELVESGPYKIVRHPLYSGALLLFGGYSLWAGPVALVLTGALAVLWALKARVEERHLEAVFPGYAAYARRVRRRLVPFLH